MSKILEKSLKDALKEDKLTMGTKQVLNSVKNSKLIVLSQSIKKETFEQIESRCKKRKNTISTLSWNLSRVGKIMWLAISNFNNFIYINN